MSNHRDWCDSKNYGITHFGIKYDVFDISSVRNDILHLRLSVIRKIIGFIQHYLEPYDYEIKQRFISILKEEWDSFYVDCYESNKSLNVIHGAHVNAFIQQLIPKVVNFITSCLEVIQVSKNLVILLNS